jgi:uncharacterized OB-fold protein
LEGLLQPRIGRWTADADGAVALHGNRCLNCGERFFPERAYCPRCRSNDLDESLMAGDATLLSYTVVHQAPAGFTTPLVVGYGVFEGDAVVLAPIDAPVENLHKGMILHLHEGPTSVSADGSSFVTYRFSEADARA